MMKQTFLKLLDPGLLILLAIMITGHVLTLGHSDGGYGSDVRAALTLPELIYRALILNDTVFNGQIWRLLTYASIHKSFGFLATGICALTFFYVKARRYSTPKHLLAVFALTAIFGGAMQIWSNWLTPVHGSSAGIYGLWGFWVGLAFMHKGTNKQTFTLLFVSIAAQYALVLLSPQSAIVAHNAGFLFGGFLGVVMPLLPKVSSLFSNWKHKVRKTAPKCAA